MSVEAMAVVLHHSSAPTTAKLVLLGIANHAGDGGAWPAVETLARYANVTERTVQRCIAELRKLGELRVDVQAGGLADRPDHRRPNLYHVLLACPATCDRTVNHRPIRRAEQRPLYRVTPVTPGDTSDTPTGDTSDTPPGDTSDTRTSLSTRREPERSPVPHDRARASDPVVDLVADADQRAAAAARARAAIDQVARRG